MTVFTPSLMRETVQYNNIVPTFSVNKQTPSFVHREIRQTASDIRTVPKFNDPKFPKDEGENNV